MFNNEPNILPYHQICLRSIITTPLPDFSTLTTAIYEECIEQDDITIVIDMFWSEISSYIHAVLLPFSIPVLSFASTGRFHDLNIESISMILQSDETVTDTNQLNVKQILTASDKYLFTMAPERAKVIELLDILANYYGWRMVGLVTVENTFFEEIIHSHHTIHAEHAR